MWSLVLAALVGIWCMVAPWLLGFEGTPAEYSHRIAGPLAATFAVVAWWEVLRGVRGVVAVAGAWLVVAPVLMMHPQGAVWNSVASGVALIVLASVPGPTRTRYGGGWRSLVGTRSTTGDDHGR